MYATVAALGPPPPPPLLFILRRSSVYRIHGRADDDKRVAQRRRARVSRPRAGSARVSSVGGAGIGAVPTTLLDGRFSGFFFFFVALFFFSSSRTLPRKGCATRREKRVHARESPGSIIKHYCCCAYGAVGARSSRRRRPRRQQIDIGRRVVSCLCFRTRPCRGGAHVL